MLDSSRFRWMVLGAMLCVAAPVSAAEVDDARLRAAAEEKGSWLTHGRDYAEQRYSPLDQLNSKNVRGLVRVWEYDTGLDRGHEATPIVADGVMYATGSWSVVFALDAKTGKELWRFDPGVAKEVAIKACCDVVNRGVAVYDGKVYFGTLDGRLIALDAKTGKPVWEVQTTDPEKSYTITGAPRVVKGRVIIGNGGAEFGVRGFVAAYDAQTGQRVWQTYTVPGNPAEGFESPALEKAAETWTGEWWKIGGGGTVWDSMAYDPELDLLYIGTGNGSPWSKYDRSPGGGDNLYLSSMLALDPDTGELKWHFQTTPGDTWDFTATQHMILADLEIDGKTRKVIMQAPKNGFFWVIDRATGEFISAEPYVDVTWADGVDETGRPIQNGSAEWKDRMTLVKPTPFGGHNWQPMSFNPQTGLVYIPAQEILGAFVPDRKPRYSKEHFNTGSDNKVFATLIREVVSGSLLAWDPVKQEAAWSHPYAMPWNGGTLTTAGNLVFQGTADGRFLALDAATGHLLWEYQLGEGVIAAPITYEVDGVQYVTIVAGWGGAFALAGGETALQGGGGRGGKVVTFALFDLPISPAFIEGMLAARPPAAGEGEDLYLQWCARCHGVGAVSSGLLPDLRKSSEDVKGVFFDIVQKGMRGVGMPGFEGILSDDEIRKIEAWVKGQPVAPVPPLPVVLEAAGMTQ